MAIIVKEHNNSNSEVSPQSRTLRIGYFPNLNHAGSNRSTTRWRFPKILSANANDTNKGVSIEPFVFSADPQQ